jgi:GNAT superfamily N-acetyltransferase
MSGGKVPPKPVRAPQKLSGHHDVSQFRNGKHASLDEWLKNRARTSEGLSARTYVICDAERPVRVVGYYAIATAMVRREGLPSAKLRRGMPEEVPLLLIGRLALDAGYQGQGLGTDLLADALRRCLAAAEIAGARGVIAHAIDHEAKRFYGRHGFLESPVGERTMLMSIETAAKLFGG